jgi:putative PIN family toxin of toxin-antitoxin system
MAAKFVIDTNVLVSALSSKSVLHWLIRLILEEKISLYVTDEILLEYEEVLKRKYSVTVADNFLIALKELPNVNFVKIYYHWALLKDADDNKFSDCYIAANANHLITNDSHFTILKSLEFPRINIYTVEELRSIINTTDGGIL